MRRVGGVLKMSKATEFYNGLKGKKVAFIGAGVSHRTLIKMFAEHGAVVTLCDKKTLDKFGDYAEELKELGIRLSLGEDYLEGLKDQDMIMRTPGFEFYTPRLQRELEKGTADKPEVALSNDNPGEKKSGDCYL